MKRILCLLSLVAAGQFAPAARAELRAGAATVNRTALEQRVPGLYETWRARARPLAATAFLELL